MFRSYWTLRHYLYAAQKNEPLKGLVTTVVPVEKDIFCAALCSTAVVYCSLLIVL